MLNRGSVAIDLGTVNTLVWVDGRGLVLDEPSTIAIDGSAGSVAAIGAAAEALADKEPKDIRVIHPLRDGVIADLDATAELLRGFLRPSGAPRGPGCGWVSPPCPPGRSGGVGDRPEEPVAAAAGAGFDLSAGEGGFV